MHKRGSVVLATPPHRWVGLKSEALLFPEQTCPNLSAEIPETSLAVFLAAFMGDVLWRCSGEPEAAAFRNSEDLFFLSPPSLKPDSCNF